MLNTIEPFLGGFVERYGCLVMLVPGAYVRSEPKRGLQVLFQNVTVSYTDIMRFLANHVHVTRCLSDTKF